MYNLYITPRSKKQLIKLSEKNVRLYKEAIDTLGKLQIGQWHGGTRVKKLHGMDNLYEARLNSGDRMLFILNNQDIYIHYVYIVHDEVNLRARNTTFSDNNSVLLEDKIDSEFEIPAEEVHKIYSSIVTDKLHVIDEDDLVRLLETEDLSSVSLKVKLVPEQELVLYKPLPLLLSGGAGSGKSTISIYRLIYEAEQLLQYKEHPKLLYLTENERLVNDVKKLFLHLCKGRDNEKRLIKAVDFYSFDTLIAPYKLDKYSRLIDRNAFNAEFALFQRGNQEMRKLNVLHVYQELLSVIGAYAIPDNRYLTKEQYYSLPIYEAPIFYKTREIIWRIQDWYKELKETKGFNDINDLIFHILHNESIPQYNLIICDEVQDFNRAKIFLSLRLLKSECKGAFIFTGDSKQTITESQFTWEGLKRLLRNQLEINEINQLDLAINYRNPSPVAKLGESLFQIPKKLGIKENIRNINAPLPGDEAVFIHGEESSLLRLLDNQDTGHSVVIVPDKKTENTIKRICQSNGLSIPFTLLPHEAKGLEFQEVWLWSIASLQVSKWTRLFQQGKVNNEEDKQFIQTEIRRLYVSLTRTLNNAYIIETNNEDFWNNKELRPISFIREENLALLLKKRRKRLYSLRNDEDTWSINAIHFYQEGKYDRCLECLDRLQIKFPLNEELLQLKKLSQAHLLMEDGEFERAGDLFNNLKAYENAVAAYDHEGLFDKIANTLDTAAFEVGITTAKGQNYAKERDLYKVRSLDRRKQFLGSGRLCMRHGNYYEAAIRFECGKFDDLLEECLIHALDNNEMDRRLLKIANEFFKRRKNHYRHAQVLKLLM